MMVRARSIVFSLASTLLASGFLAAPSFAQALESYVLENVRTQAADKSAEVFIPRIEIVGANVSRADLERLLAPDLAADKRGEMMLNMQAQRIVVPEVVLTRTGEDRSRFVLRNYVVVNLDRARFDRISFGSIEGVMTTEENGEGKFTSGPITLEGGDFAKVAAAAKAGSAADGVAKLRVFSWSGFEFTVADKAVPATAAGGNLYRFGLKSARANTDYMGDVPTKAVASFEGVFFSAPPASDAGKAIASFGYDRIEFGMNFDGAYSPPTKSFALTDYSFTGLKAGSLALSGQFADIDSSAFTANVEGRLASLMKGKIGGMNLRYVDAGLFEKALAFYAASQGKNVAAVRKEWAMMVMAVLPMLMGGDPAALKLSQALSTFVAEPKSLSISLRGKNGPVPMMDLSKFADPSALLSAVELEAVANR